MDMAVASRRQRGHFQKEHMKSSIPTEEGACASPASSMLTIESLEAMANAEEMVAAANAVAFCMADVALKTPIVEAYQRRLLATGCWRMAKDFVDPGEESPIILDPKLSYLLEGDAGGRRGPGHGQSEHHTGGELEISTHTMGGHPRVSPAGMACPCARQSPRGMAGIAAGAGLQPLWVAFASSDSRRINGSNSSTGVLP